MKETKKTFLGYNSMDDEETKAFLDLTAPLPLSNTETIVQMLVDYKETRMVYNCALKEIQTKFDVLNMEYNVRYQRNPIKFIKTRLKSTSSLGIKLQKMGKAFTIDNIEEYINDLAGIRVICSYVDDIYKLAETLINQDDITLIKKKDYIANPKSNGYRSLHLIVSVPVFFANQKKQVKVEVQIRTIAMDFWASLEHQLEYKKEHADDSTIKAELKECSDIIADTDARMLAIRKKIETKEEVKSPQEKVIEKLHSLDVNME